MNFLIHSNKFTTLSSVFARRPLKRVKRHFCTAKRLLISTTLIVFVSGCSGNDADLVEPITSDDAETLLTSSESTATCVDVPPENDGWGWDGSMSCRINTALPGQSPEVDLSLITDVVLVTGQSNTLGSNTEVEEGLDDPSASVYAWTENGWDIANLRQVWDLGWHPRTTPDGLHPHNNFALHFGKQVVSNSDRVVAFIVLSAPGRPISHWDKDKDFYQKIRSQVADALSYLPHLNELNAILWHQGENNWQGGEEYRVKLLELIGNFREESWYGENALFICGETHRAPVNIDLDTLNADDDIRTACVSSSGVGVLPDLTHFNAEGLREIGRRYGDKYLGIYNGDLSSL